MNTLQRLVGLTEVDALTQNKRRSMLDGQPLEELLGPSGTIRWLQNGQGLQLCAYYWPAAGRPKAQIVLVHGHSSYLPFEYLKLKTPGQPHVYDGSWVQTLNTAGFSVCAIDNQGCGRSAGLFGYAEGFDDYVDDVLMLLRATRTTDLPGFGRGLPMFGLGASLGGCILLTAAVGHATLLDGLLLLAPMISVEKLKKHGCNPFLLPLARVLNSFIPTWPVVRTTRNEMFPLLQKDFETNPVTYHYPTRVRTAYELVAACERLTGQLSQVSNPFIVFHSERDTMTDPDGSKQLYDTAKSADKALRLINNMWHLLSKEPGSEAILQECISWINARCTAAAAGTAS